MDHSQKHLPCVVKSTIYYGFAPEKTNAEGLTVNFEMGGIGIIAVAEWRDEVWEEDGCDLEGGGEHCPLELREIEL